MDQEPLAAEDESIESVETKKRGRAKLPTLWSRVIHVKSDETQPVRMHEVVNDLELQQQLREDNRRKTKV